MIRTNLCPVREELQITQVSLQDEKLIDMIWMITLKAPDMVEKEYRTFDEMVDGMEVPEGEEARTEADEFITLLENARDIGYRICIISPKEDFDEGLFHPDETMGVVDDLVSLLNDIRKSTDQEGQPSPFNRGNTHFHMDRLTKHLYVLVTNHSAPFEGVNRLSNEQMTKAMQAHAEVSDNTAPLEALETELRPLVLATIKTQSKGMHAEDETLLEDIIINQCKACTLIDRV